MLYFAIIRQNFVLAFTFFATFSECVGVDSERSTNTATFLGTYIQCHAQLQTDYVERSAEIYELNISVASPFLFIHFAPVEHITRRCMGLTRFHHMPKLHLGYELCHSGWLQISLGPPRDLDVALLNI